MEPKYIFTAYMKGISVAGEPGKEIKSSISITSEQNKLAEEIKTYIGSLLK